MTKLSVAVSAKDHIQGDPHAPLALVEYGEVLLRVRTTG